MPNFAEEFAEISRGLSLENVLRRKTEVDYWIGPSIQKHPIIGRDPGLFNGRNYFETQSGSTLFWLNLRTQNVGRQWRTARWRPGILHENYVHELTRIFEILWNAGR